MALALFVIGISKIFIDMGMSNAIIHKQRVNKYQLSSLFWLNIFMGLIIFIIIFICSPFIANFYNTPELKGVIDWIGTTFLVLPWGQQFESLLKKDLKFKALSLRDVIGATGGLIVAVVLAYWDYGVYSLVYANLTAAIISTTLLTFLGFKNYRPKFIFSYRSLKGTGFFSFGFYQMGEKVLNYFNSQFDTLVIGKILGMEALGLYNIAKLLALKPYQILNPIITKVAFPVFAKVQDEIVRLKRAYLKVINLLTSATAPVYVLMIILAKPIIELVFGAEWLEATPILQLLSIGALCNSIGNPIGSLQLARGRADWGFYWNLGMFASMPLTIWIGSFFGLIGVAASLAIFKIFVTILPSWYFFLRPLCKARFSEFFRSYALPILLGVISGICTFIISLLVENIYAKLLISGMAYFVVYFVLTIKTNNEFIDDLKSFGIQKRNIWLHFRKH
jgi:O-antigen/teichoic acid export membrane protein